MSSEPTLSDLPLIKNIEISADQLDVSHACEIYREYGCLIVRGLMRPYIGALRYDINAAAQNALAMLGRAKRVPEGWRTPDGSLFLEAPPGFARDKQLMVLGLNYQNSASLVYSALDKKLLDIMEGLLGPNIELFGDGHCMYKEPRGGYLKHLHQDSAYYEHRYGGPVAALNYAVDTNLSNGALWVVPFSHRMGRLKHTDTFSHLGLDENEWSWERALPVIGSAGDSIIYHYRTIHGSRENHSAEARPVFIHRYRRPDDYVIFGGATTSTSRETEERSGEAKKSDQLGLMVRGFRAFVAE